MEHSIDTCLVSYLQLQQYKVADFSLLVLIWNSSGEGQNFYGNFRPRDSSCNTQYKDSVGVASF